jgi:hypothetical protein
MMTMMLRLSLLLLALFTASAEEMCNPCGLSGYRPTKNASFSDGAGGTLTCDKVVGFAASRKPSSDACSTFITYCRIHCACKNSAGQLAPPLPVKSDTGACSYCKNIPANKLEYTPPVGVGGMKMQCQFWKQYGKKAFTPAQCPAVKSLMQKYCCGGRRHLRGETDEEFEAELDAAELEALENDPEYQAGLKFIQSMKEEELLFPVDP